MKSRKSLRDKCPNTEFSSPYFPAFGLNTEKYGPEKTPHLDTLYAVSVSSTIQDAAKCFTLNGSDFF